MSLWPMHSHHRIAWTQSIITGISAANLLSICKSGSDNVPVAKSQRRWVHAQSLLAAEAATVHATHALRLLRHTTDKRPVRKGDCVVPYRARVEIAETLEE